MTVSRSLSSLRIAGKKVRRVAPIGEKAPDEEYGQECGSCSGGCSLSERCHPPPGLAMVCSSSTMIWRQRAMHSLHILALPGPFLIYWVWDCVLPQKEHRSSSFSSEKPSIHSLQT